MEENWLEQVPYFPFLIEGKPESEIISLVVLQLLPRYKYVKNAINIHRNLYMTKYIWELI